jgi:hypothetical protein
MKLKSQENPSSAEHVTIDNGPYEGMIYKSAWTDDDPINPNHYKSNNNNLECIECMVASFGKDAVITYAEINAFKYIFRLHTKGSRTENIKKAIWYLKYALGEDPRIDS